MYVFLFLIGKQGLLNHAQCISSWWEMSFFITWKTRYVMSWKTKVFFNACIVEAGYASSWRRDVLFIVFLVKTNGLCCIRKKGYILQCISSWKRVCCIMKNEFILHCWNRVYCITKNVQPYCHIIHWATNNKAFFCGKGDLTNDSSNKIIKEHRQCASLWSSFI